MAKRPAQRGVTLVELLVTIILAAIFFAAVVPVFVFATKSNSADKVRLQAVNVAQDKLEKIRQLDYDLITQANLAGNSNTPTWKYAAEFGPTWTSERDRVYGVWYTVEELPSGGYKRVTVTVDWTAPPALTPNSFRPPGRYPDPNTPSTGITLRTLIYKQYAGPQIVDLTITSDASSGPLTWDSNHQVLTWDSSHQGTLTLTFQAVLSPQDNDASAAYVRFKGYGASHVPVLDEKVSTRSGSLSRFEVPWTPKTDGSEDGLYRFEATAHSADDLPGNTCAKQFRLESGRPPKPVVSATGGVEVVWLTWTPAAADVVQYEVFRQVESEPLKSLGFVTTQAFLDKGSDLAGGLVTGKPYNYYVVPYDAVGAGSASAVVTAKPISPLDTTKPPAPLVASVPTPAKAVLTWHDVADIVVEGFRTSGIDHYLVYQDADPNPFLVLSPKVFDTPVTWSHDITANHTYTVTAVDADLNESPRSAPVLVIYTPPPLHWLTLTSTRNADLTIKDSKGVVVGSATNATYLKVQLPEGDYSISAFRAQTLQGWFPLSLVSDKPYSFIF